MKYRDIPNFGGKYKATNTGEIWSCGKEIGCNHNGMFLSKKIDKNGYFIIGRLKRNDGKYASSRVARLVLQSFCPTKNEKLQVNHKDGNKQNDNIENLEWVTCSENIKHSFAVLNKNQKGAKNNCFKKWGYFDNNGKLFINDNKSVDEWCLENNISSTTIYVSIKENRTLKRGKFKGFRFFRAEEEFGSTDK